MCSAQQLEIILNLLYYYCYFYYLYLFKFWKSFFLYVYELLRSYSSIDINIIYNTITSLKQILYFAQLLSVYILLCFYSSVCPDADGAAAALVDLWPTSYFNLLYDLLSSSNCRTVWLCQSWLWLLTDFGVCVRLCVSRDLVVCSDPKVLLESLDLLWVKNNFKPHWAAVIIAVLFSLSVTTQHPQHQLKQHAVTWCKDGNIQ